MNRTVTYDPEQWQLVPKVADKFIIASLRDGTSKILTAEYCGVADSTIDSQSWQETRI